MVQEPTKTQKEYTVLRIDQLTRMSDIRGVEYVYRHKIKTKGGVVLDVEVDEKNFTADKAAPILLKAAQNADKILAL